MDTYHLAVTNPTAHAKNDSTSTSKSDATIFSFETGATTRANLDQDSTEIASTPNQLTENSSTETIAEKQNSYQVADNINKSGRPWKRFTASVRRRPTVQQPSDELKPVDTQDVASSSAPQDIMLSLPELPRRQSLVEELDASLSTATTEIARPASELSTVINQPPPKPAPIQSGIPPKQVYKVCTKCGKRKRPKLLPRESVGTHSAPKSRTALAVIAEDSTEPAPLLSPTNISETSTICARESVSHESRALQKSPIYSIDMSSDFDVNQLIPEAFKVIQPRSASGLSFIVDPMESLSEQNETAYPLDDDDLDEDEGRKSLSVPDTAALDTILRDMQALLDRTNARVYSMSSFDFRASPIPREIV